MGILMAEQTNLNFDFRQLNKMGSYPVLIFSRPLTNTNLKIGSLYRNMPRNTSDIVEVEFNSGRAGSSALDITITRPGTQGFPSTSATTADEPGVHAGNDHYGKPQYNLHTFGPQWQDTSGGGGHVYANDPAVVQGLAIGVKMALLKIGIITHG